MPFPPDCLLLHHHYNIWHNRAYLGGWEGQGLDGCALGGHGAVGVWWQCNAPAAPVAENGWWRNATRRDGDELAFAAFAQLLQGTALQSELVALGAGAVLSQVKGCQVAPALQVLNADKQTSHSFTMIKLKKFVNDIVWNLHDRTTPNQLRIFKKVKQVCMILTLVKSQSYLWRL